MNFGFFLLDDTKHYIYVDLFLYYLVYSSEKRAPERNYGNMLEDWKKVEDYIGTGWHQYTGFIDIRMQYKLNKWQLENLNQCQTDFYNELKKLWVKKVERFYVFGKLIGNAECICGEIKQEEKNILFRKDNSYEAEVLTEEQSKEIYHSVGISESKFHFDIVEKSLNDWLKENAVVHKENNAWIYLESANVFANEYIFVKRLFLVPEVKAYFIYCLFCKIVFKIIDSEEPVNELTLVTASDTGAMIATDLCTYLNNIFWSSSKIKINCRHMLHFGPKTNFERHGVSLDNLYSNYIYVFDFMCEGNEYRTLSNLLSIKETKLLGAFGVAIYDYPRKDGEFQKDGIETLVNVKEWTEPQYKYEIKYSLN